MYLFFYLFLFLCINKTLSYEKPNKIKGVNIGSLFVLEPYITPSLFYPFLGLNTKIIGDTYTFCEYLGPKETNKRLQTHWEKWLPYNKLKQLKSYGINTLRIPIGDWMFIPYEVYEKTENNTQCFSDALLFLDKIFDYSESLDLKIILDLHAMKDSQNGFDNSGLTSDLKTTITNNTLYFTHWENRRANWIGTYNSHTQTYDTINKQNINYSLHVIEKILDLYIHKSSFWGIEPVNEPWEHTPLDELKLFYKYVYDIYIRKLGKNIDQKVLVLHDSFRPSNWTDARFLEQDGIPKIKVYLDTHQYMAWGKSIPFNNYIKGAYEWKQPDSIFEVIVGEFSLATDNCMMWLNGFMDNLPGFPLQECFYENCPYKDLYIKEIKKASHGPFGSGISYPLENGQCPTSIPIYLNKNITPDKIWREKINKYDHDNKDKYFMRHLFKALTSGYEQNSGGWVFWNFDTESSSYQWSFLNLMRKKYIHILNKSELQEQKDIEDKKLFINVGFIIFGLTIFIYILHYIILNTRPRTYEYTQIYPVNHSTSLRRTRNIHGYGSIDV